jgi:hypothetical protein
VWIAWRKRWGCVAGKGRAGGDHVCMHPE